VISEDAGRVSPNLRTWSALAVCALSSGCTKLEEATDVLRPIDMQSLTTDGAIPAGERDAEDVVRTEDASLRDADAAPDRGDASDDAGALGCVDPSGFQGLGCFRCAPTDIVTLENACSDVECTPFDNTQRLTKLLPDGSLPELPSAGPPPVQGGGGTPMGTPSGTGTSCADLTSQGTAVHITGSTAAKPFLEQIARQLAPQHVYIVYTSTGSCVGVDAILHGTPMTTGIAPAPAASAIVWDGPTSTGKACDLPPEGVNADLGISDVFAQTCPGFELANLDAQQIRDAHGPVQTMTFAVPANSDQISISAQAAYFVFGFGKDGGLRDEMGTVGLWQDEEYILQRSATSGTQAMLAAAIGVPANRWKGKKHASSDDVAVNLQLAGARHDTANKTIGILAADYIDGRNLRAQIRVLSYRDSNQNCAVYPDSNATAKDKKNVRDGHYPIWGPLHLLYKADKEGRPANPTTRANVNDILGYLSGTKALPNGVKLLDVYAQSGLVPECAMRVTRLKDGGNMTPVKPENPCSCLFELTATGSTSCEVCKVQGDCGATETCSQGYCESL